MYTMRQSDIASIVANPWVVQMWMITVLYVSPAIWKSTMANKRIIYKDNIVIEFGSNSYHAFVINQDNDVEDKAFTTLESTKQWIDQYGI